MRLKQLKFDHLVSVKQEILEVRDRPEVENKFRKLLFFVYREGPVRTLGKIFSKKNALKLEKFQTTVVVEVQGKRFVNYSTQSSQDSDNFVVRNQFFVADEPFHSEKVDKGIFNQFIEHTLPESVALPILEFPEHPEAHHAGIFLYGLGDYARVYISKNIQQEKKIFCVDYNYSLAHYFQEKYNYNRFGLVPEESYPALQKTKKPLAIIATFHSDHTRIADEIFKQNPEALIFIEKPPCVTPEDIQTLLKLYEKGAKLEIGYNRRYIQINRKIKDSLYTQQKVVSMSVKEIIINDSHWYFWPNQGTRVTGNLTHWLDLAIFWIDGNPVEINLLSSTSKDETMAVSILFSEGSLVNITVSDKGNSLRGVQESIEVRTKNETVTIQDYTSYTWVMANGKKRTSNKIIRDKGHDAMYQHLVKVYQNRENVFYTSGDLKKSALLTYYVSQMFLNHTRTMNVSDKFQD